MATSAPNGRPLTRQFRLPVGAVLLTGWLPSSAKAWLYRRRGYDIADGVSFAFGSVISGRTVRIGRGTSIGLFSVVQADEIELARDVTIAAFTIVDTNRLRMGAGSRLNNQVVVGGMRSSSSELILGANSMIMEWSFVNTTRPVHIGDDSAVGGHGLLFTHGVWSNGFEGYPVSYGPITIGNGVWIPWRVTILPGVTIGDGAVIGGSSVVNKDVPARVLAAGAPAKVLRTAEEFLRPPDREGRMQMADGILEEMAEWLRFNDLDATYDAGRLAVAGPDGGRVLVAGDIGGLLPTVTQGDVVLAVEGISRKDRLEVIARGAAWIDVSAKQRPDVGSGLLEETALYLRRYGLRLVIVD